MKKILTILLFLLLPITAHTTNYYVDKTTGADGDDGLSEENAWETCAKVKATDFAAGDSIFFKGGEVWDETLEIEADAGSDGNPIVVTSKSDYGVGMPIIDRGDDDIHGLYIDRSPWVTMNGFEVRDLDKENDCCGAIVYKSDGCAITNNYIHHVFYAENPMLGDDEHAWELKRGQGVAVQKSSHVTVSGNTIMHCGNTGIMVYATSTERDSTINIFDNVILHNNIGITLAIADHTAGALLESVNVYGNRIGDFDPFYTCASWHRDGIQVFSSTSEGTAVVDSVNIYRNYFSDNGDAGTGGTAWLYITETCTNFQIYYNIFDEAYGCIQPLNIFGSNFTVQADHEIYNNTFYNTETSFDGIKLRLVKGCNLQNNIVVADDYCIVIDSTSFSDITLDYNNYHSISESEIAYIDTAGDGLAEVPLTLATIIANLSQDANSFDGDPLFDSTPGSPWGDSTAYNLTASSPGKDTGVDLSLGTDYEGNVVPYDSGTEDMGALEYGYFSSGYAGTAMGVSEPASVLGVSKENLLNFLGVE